MKKKVKKMLRKYKAVSIMLAWINFVSIIANMEKRTYVINQIKQYRDNMDEKNYKRLLRDVLFCKFYHGINIAEYFLFGFERLSEAGRREYMSDTEALDICDKITNKELAENFRNKYKAYLNFKQYYKRDIIYSSGGGEELECFFFEHKRFVIKPLNQSKGTGIQKIDLNNSEYTINTVISIIQKLGDCVIEEEIIQVGILEEIHPESVNTIRFATYLNKSDQVVNLYSLVRIGRGDRCVDNISSGGLFANVNMETGIIESPAFDLYGNSYIDHPDTSIQILGQKIPEWENLKYIAEDAAHVLPEQKYVGWDFAYTQNGWVIVEANHRPAIRGPQISSGHGIRRLIEETLGELV